MWHCLIESLYISYHLCQNKGQTLEYSLIETIILTVGSCEKRITVIMVGLIKDKLLS